MKEYNKFDIITVKGSMIDFKAVILEEIDTQMDSNTWNQEFLVYSGNKLFKVSNLHHYETLYTYNNAGDLVDVDINEWETDLKITDVISTFCIIPECDKLLKA